MKIKQVTVFGGSGFLGQAIVRALAPQGYLVRVAARRIELAEKVKTAGDVGQITLMRANLRVPESVSIAIAGSQAVINAAGIAFEHGRQRYKTVHAAGARTIADAARAAGVERLVHVSGIGADSRSWKNRYVQSKVEAEDAIVAGLLARPDTAKSVFELGGPRVYTYRELAALTLREIDRDKPIIGVPAGLMKLAAFFAELPAILGRTPQITRDQVDLLLHDNVVRPGALNLASLGITPTAAEVILPTYLDRFRVGGRYNHHAPA